MLCVLFICVICEKKYNCETRWGGFSLIELTELTEPFCARFKLTEGLRPTENTEASPPAPLRMERGVVCEVTPIGLLTWFLGNSFSHAGEVFLSQNSQMNRSLFAHSFEPTEGLRHTDITERYS